MNPTAPTPIRDLMDLRHEINARLPEGWTVNVASETDANGVDRIVAYPSGFDIDHETGEFSTPVVLLDPDATLTVSASLSDVEISDAFISGETITEGLNRDDYERTELAETMAPGHRATATYVEVVSAEDVWATVTMCFDIELRLTIADLTLDEEQPSIEAATEAAEQAALHWIAEEYGTSLRNVDITEVAGLTEAVI